MSAGLAKFAAAEYERRKEAMGLALDAKRLDADTAHGNVWLWLSIALRTGADHPDMYVEAIWPPAQPVKMLRCEMAEPANCRAELTRARDAVMKKSAARPDDLKLQQRAWDLEALAAHHGCKPPHANQHKEAA